MKVRDVNLQKYAALPDEMPALTKIRYKHDGASSLLQTNEENVLEVQFTEAVSGIAPGQSAVFYEGEDLIGGGFIKK